jgi:hypothetical protein
MTKDNSITNDLIYNGQILNVRSSKGEKKIQAVQIVIKLKLIKPITFSSLILRTEYYLQNLGFSLRIEILKCHDL